MSSVIKKALLLLLVALLVEHLPWRNHDDRNDL